MKNEAPRPRSRETIPIVVSRDSFKLVEKMARTKNRNVEDEAIRKTSKLKIH